MYGSLRSPLALKQKVVGDRKSSPNRAILKKKKKKKFPAYAFCITVNTKLMTSQNVAERLSSQMNCIAIATIHVWDAVADLEFYRGGL